MRVLSAALAAAAFAALTGAAVAALAGTARPLLLGLILGGACGVAVAATVLLVLNRLLGLELGELASWLRGPTDGSAVDPNAHTARTADGKPGRETHERSTP